jgi:GntR family transcriptional regulator
LFVATQDAATMLRLHFHLVDDMGRKELPAFHSLLGIRTRKALPREARSLDLSVEARVTAMKRMRSFSDGSLMLEHVVLPEALFPNFAERLGDARPTLLYDFYEQAFAVSVMSIEERVRATMATRDQARLIGCAEGGALLEIERRAYGHGSLPVEMRITYSESRKRAYFRGRL